MDLDIIEADPRWSSLGLAALAHRAATATLTRLALDPQLCELSVLGCDDARITTLNTDYRGKPQPTNVLSWPAEARSAARAGDRPPLPEPGFDGTIALGDIAISYDTSAAEAQAADKQLSAHVTHLIVHAVLHLLGYDHIDDADAALMEGLEVEILGKLGLDDPY